MDRRLTEHDGRTALRDHLVEKAVVARGRYGPAIDAEAIRRILDDREIVRYPTGLRFDAGPLKAGEFAWGAPLGDSRTASSRSPAPTRPCPSARWR